MRFREQVAVVWRVSVWRQKGVLAVGVADG